MIDQIPISVVVVTRNHVETIGPTLESLANQLSPADAVVIVDCGSDCTDWMTEWERLPGFSCVRLGLNAGFTGGNNQGWRRLQMETGFVLFLNPDVVLPPELLGRLRTLVSEPRAAGFGALSPRLLSWDFTTGQPTGRVDSTGIFPVWRGGWRDRREDSPGISDRLECVPALCGAFFLARVEALREVLVGGGDVWDDRYFAYKEDIELSLRLRRSGWRLGVWHGGEAYHGRGWKVRDEIPRSDRLRSARNEVRLHGTYRPWKLPLSLVMWSLVKWLDR